MKASLVIIWTLGILAGMYGVSYAIEETTGIPNLVAGTKNMGPYVAYGLGGLFVIGALAGISQGALQKAGLSGVGEMAKADQTIKLRGGLWRRHGRRLRNKMYGKIDGWLAKHDAISRWEQPAGYQPKSFEDNRILIFALMDYALRLDTFIAKWYRINHVISPKMTQLNSQLGKWTNLPRLELRLELMHYRSGVQTDGNGKYGWASFDKDFIENLNQVIQLMANAIQKGSDKREIVRSLRRIKDDLGAKGEVATVSYGEFLGRIDFYGVHHEMHSLVLNLHGMYNPASEYKHHYILTKPGAQFRRDEHIADSASVDSAPEGIEVDICGFEVDKKNEREISIKEAARGRKIFGLGSKPRKLLNPRSMSMFESPLNMVEHLKSEWEAFMRTFRLGNKVKNTRRISDYDKAFEVESKIDVYLDDDSVAPKGLPGNVFDRRALANPGNLPYKGRKRFNDPFDKAEPDETYPMLTVAGMQEYLRLLIKHRERESVRIIDEFLTKLPDDDTKKWPKTEEELANVVRAALSERERKDKTKNGSS